MRFDPACETDESLCCEPIRCAIRTYCAGDTQAFEEDNCREYLPLKNLITLSLDHNGRYLGNAHRWDCAQVHIFSDTEMPRGFLKPSTLCGRWSGMLHIHEIISPQCLVELTIDVEAANGMAPL